MPKQPRDPAPAKPRPLQKAQDRARRRANRPDPDPKRAAELQQELRDSPELELGVEGMSAAAMSDLARSSPLGKGTRTLRIPRTYLNALLNL